MYFYMYHLSSMDKTFQFARWAKINDQTNELVSHSGPQPIQMVNSDGTALSLVLDDSTPAKFGADIVRFEAGKGVGLHKHAGAHILMVTKGKGLLTYFDTKHEMFEGMIYLIPSNVPHAIEAETELVLVAIGNDHQPADSSKRLELVTE
jgi:quercetin dioxygenase-like cupin family protein